MTRVLVDTILRGVGVRLILAVSLLLSILCGANATVAVDVRGTAAFTTTNGTSHSYTGLTTGTGLTNPGIVCVVTYDSGTAVSGQSATWAGSSTGVTKLFSELNSNAGNAVTLEVWGIIPSTLGAQTFALSWTSPSTTNNIYCMSFTGVNQTGGTTSFPNAAGANDGGTASTPAHVTITSATGDWIVAGFSGGSTFNSGGQCSGCTSDYNTMDHVWVIAGADITGTSSQSMTYAMSGADNWTAAGTDVKAAPASSACNSLALLGVGC